MKFESLASVCLRTALSTSSLLTQLHELVCSCGGDDGGGDGDDVVAVMPAETVIVVLEWSGAVR